MLIERETLLMVLVKFQALPDFTFHREKEIRENTTHYGISSRDTTQHL